MNKSGNVIPIFSTPIVLTNINREFTKNELQCIANIPMIKNEKPELTGHITTSNSHSEETYLFDNFTEEFKDIKSFCEHHIKHYLQEIEGANENLVRLRITQSWLNNTKSQEVHYLHSHGNSYISGVLYINTLPNDNIIFENRLYGIFNGTLLFPYKKITAWNAHQYAQNIKKGDLILFPSWIPHQVGKNETKDTERISLSFNTFPIGEMGTLYGNHLKL